MHIKKILDELLPEVATRIVDELERRGVMVSSEEARDNNDGGEEEKSSTYLTITEASREIGVSRSTLYRAVEKGELAAYQFGGSGKNYLKRSEIEEAMEILPAPSDGESFQEFESAVRKAVERGRELRKHWEEFRSRTENPTVSEFARYLDDQGVAHLLRRPILMIDDGNLTDR